MTCGETGAPGNLYADGTDYSTMPFYNADGQISGMIIGMDTPGESAKKPPYVKYTTRDATVFWGIEANFRDPASICMSDSTTDIAFGDRLWFANGSHTSYLKTPLNQCVEALEKDDWILSYCSDGFAVCN